MTINPTHLSPQAPVSPRRTGWTHSRIVALIVGLFLLLGSAGVLVGGGAVLAVDDEWRKDGYLTSNKIPLTTPSYAVAATGVEIDTHAPESLLGTARLRATATDSSTPVFLGVARTERVAAYLDGVAHATATEIGDNTEYVEHPGGAPATAPADSDIWMAKTSGTGTQVLAWSFADGPWTVVVMNADGSAGVAASTDVGATLPVLPQIGRWLLVGGLVIALGGAVLILAAVNLLPHRRRPTQSGQGDAA